jgi:hypothetical protein
MNGLKAPQQGMQLFEAEGRRLYLTEDERRAFYGRRREGLSRGAHLLWRAARDWVPDFRSQDRRPLLVTLGDDLEEQVGLFAPQQQVSDLIDGQELVLEHNLEIGRRLGCGVAS